MDFILDYISENWVELLGAILSLIYLYLSVRQRTSLWIFGFLCSALYVVVFFESKFYADMSLQFYYLFVSVYGWVNWKWGKQKSGDTLPIQATAYKEGFWLLMATIAIYLFYFFVLISYTDSPLPKADSFATALSITATWMLARKKIEQWILWVIVDALSAGMYFYKQLYPTAILFIVYTVMAIIGFLQWRKALLQQRADEIE